MRSLTATDTNEETTSFAFLDKRVAEAITSSASIDVLPLGSTRYVIKGDSLIHDSSDVGSVIATTKGQELGLAMVRLDRVLKSSEDESRSTDSQCMGMNSGATRLIVRQADGGDEDSKDSSTIVRVFRPSWWPDTDPVTGRSMLAA